MLTRLLGQEQAAIADYAAKKISHPFTDVPDWAAAHVAYLYENGLTTGATATAFESENPCTDQMYTTFLLRALGYFEKNGDFAYETAVEFAAQLGLVDDINLPEGDFLRDHVVAMTYTALAVSPKDAESSLLEQLVESGAVSSESAAATLELFAQYEALNLLLAGVDSQVSRDFSTQHETANSMNGTLISSQFTQVDVTVLPGQKVLSWVETTQTYSNTDQFIVDETAQITSQGYVEGDVVKELKNGIVSQTSGSFADYYDQYFQVESELLPVSAVKSLELTKGEDGDTYGVQYVPSLASPTWAATETSQSFRWLGSQLLESITLLSRVGATVDSAVATSLTVHNQGDGVTWEPPF